MSINRVIFSSLIFSISIILTLPPFNFWPAAYCMYIPLMYVWHNCSGKLKVSLIQGILSGFLISSFIFWGGMSDSSHGALLYFIIQLYFIVYFTVLFFLLHFMSFHKNWFFLYPVVFFLYEYFVEILPGLFPLYTALSITGHSQIVGNIGILGIKGIGAGIILINAFLCYTALHGNMVNRIKVLILGVSIFIILILPFKQFKSEPGTFGKKIKIAYVQASINYWEYFFIRYSDTYSEKILNEYLDLLDLADGVDCVVLPESAITGEREIVEKSLDILKCFAEEKHCEIVFSSAYYGIDKKPYNAAINIGRDGSIEGVYKKVNLVAIGEADTYTRGDSISTFQIDNCNAGMLICYDSFFKDMYEEYLDTGVDFYIVLANDSFANISPVSWLHFSYSRLFSAQYKIPVIHVAQSGCSGIILPDGAVDSFMQPFEKGLKIIEMDMLNRLERPGLDHS